VELLVVSAKREFRAALHAGQRSILVGHFFHLSLSQRLVRAGRRPRTIKAPALPEGIATSVYRNR
jgi:hypothetical protein